MDGRIPPGSFFQYSPTGVHGVHGVHGVPGPMHRSSSPSDRER